MPGCILRSYGKKFDVDGFLRRSSLKPLRIYKHHGRLKARQRHQKNADVSGFDVLVSNKDGKHLNLQVKDAVLFLKRNRAELVRLRCYKGVNEVVLDFGIYRRDVPGQFDHFPAKLIQLAGEIGLGIELSSYATA